MSATSPEPRSQWSAQDRTTGDSRQLNSRSRPRDSTVFAVIGGLYLGFTVLQLVLIHTVPIALMLLLVAIICVVKALRLRRVER